MARNINIPVTSLAWVELTNSDTTAITFMNVGNADVRIMATVGAVAPVIDDAPVYSRGQGERASQALSGIFAQPAGVNRLWGKAVSQPTTVYVNHA